MIDRPEPMSPRQRAAVLLSGVTIAGVLAAGAIAVAAGPTPAASHKAYPNFVCVAVGDWGVCVGPPTKYQ